jgi:uncharacterized circularly permuted ATP-grasp superfamily protein
MKTPFDEMLDGGERVREQYRVYDEWLKRQPTESMQSRRSEAEMIFRRVGITFAVYGDKDEGGAGTERLIPFDLIPRIIPQQEWAAMEAGLRQRVTALNRFIHDVSRRDPLAGRAGRAGRTTHSTGPHAWGQPRAVPHIAGIGARARRPGGWLRAGSNLRVPSGVSYMRPQDDDAAVFGLCLPVAHHPSASGNPVRGPGRSE